VLFYVKIHVKIARLFIIVREFSSKVPSFILHGSMTAWNSVTFGTEVITTRLPRQCCAVIV